MLVFYTVRRLTGPLVCAKGNVLILSFCIFLMECFNFAQGCVKPAVAKDLVNKVNSILKLGLFFAIN